MAKTDLTKTLEQLLAKKFDTRNDFYAFEVTIGWYGNEIVDCLVYNCKREVSCFEIKSSVSDFHSKSAWTFVGHKNYFVMPYSVYEKVKDEIPDRVGVFVAIDRMEHKEGMRDWGDGTQRMCQWADLVDGVNELYCIHPCRKRDLKADREVLLSSLLRCMQRDYLRGSKFAYTYYKEVPEPTLPKMFEG